MITIADPILRNLIQFYDCYIDKQTLYQDNASKTRKYYVINELIISTLDTLSACIDHTRPNLKESAIALKIIEGVARSIQVCLGIFILQNDEEHDKETIGLQTMINLLHIGNTALSILKPSSEEILGYFYIQNN